MMKTLNIEFSFAAKHWEQILRMTVNYYKINDEDGLT